MSTATVPIFVVGSGRSGTRTIYKLLSGIPGIEIYHEFVCTHVQPLAALYFMNRISKDALKRELMNLHGSAINYSQDDRWVDCSNKLSWIIEPLYELFPKAKFIHLVRDGRKVANSFFHKLNDEMYDDRSVQILQDWLSNKNGLLMPPPEKKYWWNIPQQGQPFAEEFPRFDQFQRACYQWREANRVILESLKNVHKDQQLFVRLEDLIQDRNVLKDLLAFFGLEYEEHFYEYLQTPQNVIFPMDFRLTEAQKQQFKEIAWDMMEQLGYAEREEYVVEY
jgi:hypothetical protein